MQVKSGMNISTQGIKDIAANLDIAEDLIHNALRKALYAEGRLLIDEAGQEVPKDTRALYNSRFVAPPNTGKEGIKLTCGFGTASTINAKTKEPTSNYALIVHERLDVVHPNGKAKFLEDPANRLKSKLEANLAARVANSIGR